MSALNRVLALVRAERERQDAKWGEQNHDQLFWFAILGEEFGEVGKEVVEAEAARQRKATLAMNLRRDNIRMELLQLAAVAVAQLESLARNEGIELPAPEGFHIGDLVRVSGTAVEAWPPVAVLNEQGVIVDDYEDGDFRVYLQGASETYKFPGEALVHESEAEV